MLNEVVERDTASTREEPLMEDLEVAGVGMDVALPHLLQDIGEEPAHEDQAGATHRNGAEGDNGPRGVPKDVAEGQMGQDHAGGRMWPSSKCTIRVAIS